MITNLNDVEDQTCEGVTCGWVYAVRAGDQAVKFGLSFRDPKRRRRELSVGSFVDLKLVASIKTTLPEYWEKCLHLGFKRFRLRGEWFKLCPMTLGLIDIMRDGDVDKFHGFIRGQVNRQVKDEKESNQRRWSPIANFESW